MKHVRRNYARKGKKAIDFDSHCKALGVVFNFSRSDNKLLLVDNTESRKQELLEQIQQALQARRLTKQKCLVLLRGLVDFWSDFN